MAPRKTVDRILNLTKSKPIKLPGATPLGSPGYDNIRDDIEATKSLREGSVVRTPTEPFDMANKAYVDAQFPVTHVSTTGKTTDDHHAQSHSHASHTGIGENDHHNKAAGISLGSSTNNNIMSNITVDNDQIASDNIEITHVQSQPARALNTTYQNTNGNPIIVHGCIRCDWSDDHITPNNIAYFKCLTDGNSPPTTEVQRGGTLTATGIAGLATTSSAQYFSFYFVVADNDYYRINSVTVGATAVLLQNWNEVNF